MNSELDLMVKTMALIDKVLEAPRMSESLLCPLCHYAPLYFGEAHCMACEADRIERETKHEHYRRDRAFEDSQKEL